MRLSRIATQKKNRKSRFEIMKKKQGPPKKRLKRFVLSVALIGAPLLSTSVAFADVKISDYLKSWYSERVSEVQHLLIHSTESNATIQKANLLRQVREETEASIKDLQVYADVKQMEINERIRKEAAEALEKINSENQKELDSTKESIDAELEPISIEPTEIGNPKSGEIMEENSKDETGTSTKDNPATENNTDSDTQNGNKIEDSVNTYVPKPEE